MKCLLGRKDEIDVDNLPWGPEDERTPAGIETVIVAQEVRPARGRVVDVVEVSREGGRARRVVVGSQQGDGVEADAEDDVVLIKDEPEDD